MQRKTQSGIVTFLFTDVDYPAPSFQTLNEGESRTLWREHSEIVREEYQGQTRPAGQPVELRNLGDGFMLVFPNVLDALACSVRIQQEASLRNERASGENHLPVRIGLHAGEPWPEKDGYFGKSLLIAKRLCECAHGGQILAAGLVHKLAGQRTGYTLRDIGPLTLRGVAEPFPACEVIWSVEAMSDHHLVGIREALLRGDIEEASLQADLALKTGVETGSPFLSAMSHLVKTCITHEQGKHQQASEHLARALKDARRSASPEAQFNALWTKAQFAFEQCDEISGLDSLQKALKIGRERGYLSAFVDRPAIAAELCVHALEAGIEIEYVKDIIRKRSLVPETPPIHLENWPWTLKIYTLGRFMLTKDDTPVKFPRKAQQRPLSLLMALIAFGAFDKGTGDAQLADTLWPEADGDVAHRSLATTLHRLRKLIGRHDAIQLRECRLTMDPRCCWVDAWTFENLLSQAETMWRKDSDERNVRQAIQMTQTAIDIYRGPFLAGENDEPWILSPRERLQSKFLRSINKLAHYWEGAKQWKKAAACYQRGLEVDDLTEEFYRGIMICYLQLGLRAEALIVYDRCRKILSASLNVQPSRETEAVRESLLTKTS
ncbi:hypothetical protein HZA56_00730 [Candidatus Poribacteria bacterium]|nr:hypothetical protein [Candidatus Poribacteria bacterium]